MINVEAECFVCGSPWTEEHHVIYRSQGGTETASICRKCHDRVHAHRFELELLDDATLVLSRNGVEILRRKTMSDAEFAEEWESVYEYMAFSDTIEPDIPRFKYSQLKLAYQEAAEMVSVGKRLKRIILVEYWRRMEAEEMTTAEKKRQMSGFFDIGYTEVANLVGAIEKIGPGEFIDSPLPDGFLIDCSNENIEDPQYWMNYAIEERLKNPHFSRQDLRADMKNQPRPGTCPGCGSRMSRTWKCEECE